MAFNEELNLESVVSEVDKILDGIHYPAEITIINDGSTDNTGRISDELTSNNDRIHVIHHSTNQGLGGVYRSGFYSTKGDFLTFYPHYILYSI